MRQLTEAWMTAISKYREEGRDITVGHVFIVHVSRVTQVMEEIQGWGNLIDVGSDCAKEIEGSFIGFFCGVPVRARFDLPPHLSYLIRVEEWTERPDINRN